MLQVKLMVATIDVNFKLYRFLLVCQSPDEAPTGDLTFQPSHSDMFLPCFPPLKKHTIMVQENHLDARYHWLVSRHWRKLRS